MIENYTPPTLEDLLRMSSQLDALNLDLVMCKRISSLTSLDRDYLDSIALKLDKISSDLKECVDKIVKNS